MNRFEFCVDFVLQHETEFHADGSAKVEHDPHDPGGTTKYGIDQRAHPNVDIENLSRAQAERIYFDGEWSACRCSELNPPWDLALFDAAVNVGVNRAVKWMQEAVGTTPDGYIGPKTIAAVNGATPAAFDWFIGRRQEYYTSEVRTALRLRYMKGWLARVDAVRQAARSDFDRRIMA